MRALALVLLLLAACSPNVDQDMHPTRKAEPAPSAGLASQDREFLERAAEGHNAEMAIGRLGARRGVRPDVTAFGAKMVADHGAMKQQLMAIAAAKHISLPTGLGEHQQNYDRLVDRDRDEFDREFAKVMLGEHQQAAELFRGEAKNGVDPDLKAYAAAMVPKIEEHLHHAESLR